MPARLTYWRIIGRSRLAGISHLDCLDHARRLLVALAGAALAQDIPPGHTRVSPGASTRVFVMAAFDKDCRSLPAPKIDITQAPAKGSVSFREKQTTTVQFSQGGTCNNARVEGTGIYYTARPDASGADTFSISARLGAGEPATRTFKLFITD